MSRVLFLWRARSLIRNWGRCCRDPRILQSPVFACRQLLPGANLYSAQPEALSFNKNLVQTEPAETKDGQTNSEDAAGLEQRQSGLEQGQEPEQVEKESVPLSEQKSIRVAIIGAPNAGKSTLVNQLLQQKVFAVSPKVHTTTRKAMGVFTEGNTQVVLMDTPGIISNSYARQLRKSREFSADPLRSIMEADIVLVLVDAVNKFTRERIDVNILKLLRQYPHLNSILVLNKTDVVMEKSVLLKLTEILTGSDDSHRHEIGFLVRKWKDRRLSPWDRREARKKIDQLEAELAEKKEVRRRVLESLKAKAAQRAGLGEEHSTNDCTHPEGGGEHVTTEAPADDAHSSEQMVPSPAEPDPQQVTSNHWPFFDDVFMVSGLKGDGIAKLKQYFFDSAKSRAWEYSESAVTDLPAITLIQDIIHEKICLHFNHEMPYVVRQENVIWEKNEWGILNIYQYLYCGKKTRLNADWSQGKMIQQIKEEAEQDIEKLLKCPVNLTLDVKT